MGLINEFRTFLLIDSDLDKLCFSFPSIDSTKLLEFTGFQQEWPNPIQWSRAGFSVEPGRNSCLLCPTRLIWNRIPRSWGGHFLPKKTEDPSPLRPKRPLFGHPDLGHPENLQVFRILYSGPCFTCHRPLCSGTGSGLQTIPEK